MTLSKLNAAIQDQVIEAMQTVEAKIPRELIEMATRTAGFHASFDYGGVHVLITDWKTNRAKLVYLQHEWSETDPDGVNLTVGVIWDENYTIEEGVKVYMRQIFATEFEPLIEELA